MGNNYAVIDGDNIVNVIVAETAEVAEAAVGLPVVATEGSPWIGWTRDGDGWRPPRPFPSWEWNGTEWEAPTPYPEGAAAWWDEENQTWVIPPAPNAE